MLEFLLSRTIALKNRSDTLATQSENWHMNTLINKPKQREKQ